MPPLINAFRRICQREIEDWRDYLGDKWKVAVNGQLGQEYDIVIKGGTTFRDDRTLAFMAVRNSGIYKGAATPPLTGNPTGRPLQSGLGYHKIWYFSELEAGKIFRGW